MAAQLAVVLDRYSFWNSLSVCESKRVDIVVRTPLLLKSLALNAYYRHISHILAAFRSSEIKLWMAEEREKCEFIAGWASSVSRKS
ncbi:hypothetical protein BaRGS_00037959 [Batillaria attramentaria]|uniref:Uncharacterized protein n=1 Tax=Batillaria attramentaria TaxID=370345 RepID=A0ABD0J870_9CAEN